MPRTSSALLLAALVALACASEPAARRHTLAELRNAEPDVTEVEVDDSLAQAMLGYRKFLEEAPESELTPEAMRRLADLKLEKEYGLLGDGEIVELPAPEPSWAAPVAIDAPERGPTEDWAAPPAESDSAFERRASAADVLPTTEEFSEVTSPEGTSATQGPLEAIALYDQILEKYPGYPQNDQVLYQKARALDELGRIDEAIAVIEQLIAAHPHSRHIDEVQFRRAEYFFTRRKWLAAEAGYSAIVVRGPGSEYYELALYKLGWTFYKQDLLDEALDEYVRLLDYKVATGYDFDQAHDEDAERRIADTFRVISLSFSNLGGPESVSDYFAAHGERSYEDRIYAQLGEFYLEKLRYQDAAKAYKTFIALHPLHRISPHFSKRVVEVYEAGGFPKLVLEAKKEFAASYGLSSEYWRHHDVAAEPAVIDYLKTNLADLASHHHSLFQDESLAAERHANYDEALRWYRAYLDSFPSGAESAGINRRLADLLLENRDFGGAAREYERTAYEYAAHEGAASAGYAAIYAHRERLKSATGEAFEAARREAVASTLRFVEVFPQHEQAAAVLGAAVGDLYEMKDYSRAIDAGRKLIDRYPAADESIRRSAWTAVAHSSFELADYAQAEQAYGRVLEMTPADAATRPALADNLAAAIYKQGEQANQAGDGRAAATHFLRIAQAAPDSAIRPAAEYDAAAALMRLEDWSGAAAVLEDFRANHPDHELAPEATKQLALVYRKQEDLSRAAAEYERVAAQAEQPALRGEALLVAGDLYEKARQTDRALALFLAYVNEFPEPIETAVETRFRIAGLYEAARDEAARRDQLREIVSINASAGAARSARVRTLAARSALVLAENLYQSFGEVVLSQPFEQNLQEKQRRMDAALGAFDALVDYEVGEVTAAATFYMAEIYSDFGRALSESERPTDLDPRELQSYELALEEEAFPFEEKAIAVHEKNLELMSAGVFNAWTEKSLARLAALMPGRYAKSELSSGYLAEIGSYTYQAPTLPVAPSAAQVAETASPASDEPAPQSPTATESAPAPAAAEGLARADEEAEAPLPASPAEERGGALPAEPLEPLPVAFPTSEGEEPAAGAEDVASEVEEESVPPPASPAEDSSFEEASDVAPLF